MSIHLKVVAAILRKDLRSLLPIASVVSLILIIEAFVSILELESAGIWTLVRLYLPYVSMAACAILIVAIFQQDPAESSDHDWLTRPIAKLDLLLAKLAFLFVTILAPLVIAHFIANVARGHSVVEALLEATVFESSETLLLIVFLVSIAMLSRSFMQTIGMLLITFVALLLFASLPSIFTPSPESFSDDAISFGASWIQAIVLLLLQASALWLVYTFQYCQRDGRRARMAVGAATLLSLAVMTLPFVIPVWPVAFPLLKATVGNEGAEAAEALQLDSSYGCYPASVIGNLGSDKGSNGVAVSTKLIGMPYWDETLLRKAGAGGVTYATLVSGRNLPSDWRVMPLKVTATYEVAGLSGQNKFRPAHVPMSTSLSQRNAMSNYWLASEEMRPLATNDPATKVQFDYRLALLAPTSYVLEIDSVRRPFPKLGYCSARRDMTKNQVIVNCFKRGPQPTLVSAELVNVSASRVDAGPPNFGPHWLDTFDGQHYEMVIQSPTLVSNPQILVTAFDSQAFVKKQRVDSGLLGGQSCRPVNTSMLAQSQWNDPSGHKSSVIAVDQGVSLEVLNWGGPDSVAGKEPRTLVLLAGAGGTAHYYDDLAPILAKQYRVIGITRRGFGASSKPDFGYDIARLSADVIQVLDTLKVQNPVLVGHSFAGDELTFLSTRYPNRFAGLVYLDAAYDRSHKISNEKSLMDSLPPRPLPTPSELVSRAALQVYLDRIDSVGLPEGELMASMDLSLGRRKHDERHAQALITGVVAPEYEKITVPTLAMYAVSSSAQHRMEPWYDKSDPRTLAAVNTLFELRSAYQAREIAQFKERVPHAEVIELKDADHSIFISNRDDVVRAMDKFIRALK